MKQALKAEFRKLFTARSTIVITGICLLLVVFFAFYIEGLKINQASLADPNRLASEVTNAIMSTALLLSLVGLLLFSHEYRYNTISYTLTSSNSRTRVLLAKILAVSCYALILSLLIGALSPTLTYLGVQIRGLEFSPQVFPLWDLLWRSLFFGWAYAMAALLLAALVRSQVGALAVLFLLPTAGEGLLSLAFRSNAVYLPFTALQHVILTGQGSPEDGPMMGQLSPGKAAAVFSIYLVAGWLVAWVLFLKRDAGS